MGKLNMFVIVIDRDYLSFLYMMPNWKNISSLLFIIIVYYFFIVIIKFYCELGLKL